MPPAQVLLLKLCRRYGRSEVLNLTYLKAGFGAANVLYKRIARLLSVQLALAIALRRCLLFPYGSPGGVGDALTAFGCDCGGTRFPGNRPLGGAVKRWC